MKLSDLPIHEEVLAGYLDVELANDITPSGRESSVRWTHLDAGRALFGCQTTATGGGMPLLLYAQA